jgi:flagellar basal-body rod protein FlgG
MIRGFYAARSGVLGQQQNMNTIANNFANIGTMGSKPQLAAFSTLLYAKIHGGAARPDEANRLRPPYDLIDVDTGHGSRVEHTTVNYAQGGLASTGVPTDMAIIGEGFFAVMGGEGGEILYTRDGQFHYSVDGESRHLVDAGGRYVLDAGGAEIVLEGGAEITPGKVGVFKFPNRNGMSLLGSNRLAATEASGEAEAVELPNVQAGVLERSGVDTAAEVVRMIESQRAFSLNARVLTTIDEMDDVANQMR